MLLQRFELLPDPFGIPWGGKRGCTPPPPPAVAPPAVQVFSIICHSCRTRPRPSNPTHVFNEDGKRGALRVHLLGAPNGPRPSLAFQLALPPYAWPPARPKLAGPVGGWGWGPLRPPGGTLSPNPLLTKLYGKLWGEIYDRLGRIMPRDGNGACAECPAPKSAKYKLHYATSCDTQNRNVGGDIWSAWSYHAP